MARGGRRAGRPGAAYSNRTDLHQPLPVAAPTGLPYGARGELIAAQRQVPMAPAPSPAGGSPQPPAPVPPGHPSIALGRPTERPQEPITAGIPLGPGPGPEALTNTGMAQQNVTALLGQLANQPGATSEVGELARYAASGKS